VALAPPSHEVLDFVARVAQAYAKLIAAPSADRESGLGGRLFYAGEIDEEGRALVVAANIAGAATLVASADPAAQKQAIRGSIVDFLVTSLDESLRILKNQLRKHETVSVCAAIAPSAMEREMKERGVRPDLLRSDMDGGLHSGTGSPTLLTPVFLTWTIAAAPARWMPQLDVIALECLDTEDWAARRWLRLAARYLGRTSQATRALACSQEAASRFTERIQERVKRGEIGVPIEIRWRDARGHEEKHRLELGKP
jgi:urocanate hydratase